MVATSQPRLAVSLGTPVLKQNALRIDNFTGSTISLTYTGLPGNQPQSYGNFVALWQATVVPWTVPPIKKVPISQNTESGSMVLDGLTIVASSYILGYGTGPEITTLAATALLSAGGLRAAPASVSIGINQIGPTSLSVHYQTLAGALPRTYGHRIGLWKGYASPYNAPLPIRIAAVESDSSEDDVGMNDIQLAIRTTYTLVYFTGREPTSAAAILTFDTASPNDL